MKKIENINVTLETAYSSAYALCWTKGNERYHIWLDRETKKAGLAIYKNPSLDVKYKEAGYFAVRVLSVEAKQNKKDFAVALSFAERNNLFNNAEAEIKSEIASEHVRHMQAVRQRQLEKAGPMLYAAMWQIENIPLYRADEAQTIARQAIQEADKA